MYISMKLPEGKKIQVPDNLDLAWHAKLSINGLMGTIDPNCHYLSMYPKPSTICIQMSCPRKGHLPSLC